MKNKRYHNPTSFLDLLFNCLVGFVFLFVMSFLLIAPPIEDQQKKPKAEFLTTLTWDGTLNDDIDLWMQNPLGDIMFFREKEKGFMHLDRDDLGHSTDTIYYRGQVITKNINQEIATIRGVIPGEWVINLHMYGYKSGSEDHVNVRIDKLNPRFTTILDKNYIMKTHGEELTVTRMVMNTKGEIINQDDTLYPMVANRLARDGGL